MVIKIVPIVSFCIIILSASLVHAEITEGNATVNVITNTSVEGEGTVSTQVETTVNGRTTKYESNEPGEHKVNISSNNPISTPVITNAPTNNITITTTPSVQIKKEKTPYNAFSFLEEIKKFFKNLFGILTR